MSQATITVKPYKWDRKETPERRDAPFRAAWRETVRLLRQECNAIDGFDIMILMDVQPCDIKMNGFVYADAVAGHPGVQIGLSSRHGRLMYACDRFNDWQDNVRAIALTLERLRKAEAYGVVQRGEQYQGFVALPMPDTLAPESLSPADEIYAVADWLSQRSKVVRSDILTSALKFQKAYRQAAQALHPDRRGGSEIEFKKLQQVKTRLVEHHAGKAVSSIT